MANKAEMDWQAIKKRIIGLSGVTNIDVTLLSLTVGNNASRDDETGWRSKDFPESTIEMIVIPRGANSLHLVPGLFARIDAVGRTRDYAKIGDQIKTAAGMYYEVKAVRSNYVGDLLWHRDCDLTELPLHD